MAHRASTVDLLLLVLTLSFLLPGALVAVGWIVGLASERLRDAYLGTLVGVLVSAVALQVLNRMLDGPPWGLIAASLIAGAAFTRAYFKSAGLRVFATYLGAASLLFPAMFLVSPGVRGLILPNQGVTTNGQGARAPAPIAMIIFDQLPLSSLMDSSGNIDAARFPAFAELASRATWYRNATSVAENSAWAIPAILTGTYPNAERRIANWRGYPDNPFALLESSYRLIVQEPVTELCHPDACNVETTPVVDRLWAQASDLRFVLAHILAPRAWASSLPSLSENWRAFGEQSDPIEEYEQWRAAGESWSFQERWSNVRDEDRRGDAETFVDRIGRESGRNTLKFAHILLPHAPFVFLPSGKLGSLDNSMPGLIVPGDRWNEDEYAVSQVYQRHLLQVGYVDWVLGRMLRRLTEDGLLDQTLLIVTSDHGASFRAGDAFKDPTSTNVTDLMSVPLFVKYPSQADGRIDDRNAETIDILPTIADVIDIEVPWDLDGTPLTDDSAPERTRKIFVVAGGSLRMTIDPLRIHERKETIARKEALFQPGSEPWDITRLGPRSDLVGQHVLDLAVGDHSAVEICVDHDAVFSRLRLDGDYIPSLISGSVTRDPDERARWTSRSL